jgi:iron uptake system EfeUOB component EfeO/EfeM
MPASRLVPLLAVPVALTLTGCGGGGPVKTTVHVTASTSACGLDATTIAPGRTAFVVGNTSGSEAEFYLYTARGSKVDEVEGIADGTSRTLTATLKPGRYAAACKPDGKDLRTPFTVS